MIPLIYSQPLTTKQSSQAQYGLDYQIKNTMAKALSRTKTGVIKSSLQMALTFITFSTIPWPLSLTARHGLST